MGQPERLTPALGAGWLVGVRVLAGLGLAGLLVSAAAAIAVVGLSTGDVEAARVPPTDATLVVRILWAFAFGGVASVVLGGALLAAWWGLVDRGWRVAVWLAPLGVVGMYVAWFVWALWSLST
jgi:hypothetical protein